VSSATVTVPVCILLTNLRFVVVGSGTRHRLASNRSAQLAPDTPASGGQRLRGKLGGPAASVMLARMMMLVAIRIGWSILLSSWLVWLRSSGFGGCAGRTLARKLARFPDGRCGNCWTYRGVVR
jgi:hypothetical protein